MKKKSLLSMLLVAGLGLATTSTVVSCKDYDDDISSVNKRVDDLNGQLKTLQDALDKCKSECAAAHATFVTKTELGQAKEALTALAQQAAATAKAEAIAEAIEQCKALIAGKANQADLDKLATRVASIEETLLTLKDYAKISYVDAADKNLQDQIDAIKKWKELIDANTAALKDKADVTYVDGKVKEINGLISDLSKKVGGLVDDMDALKKQMNELSDKVDGCEAKVNVLSVLVNKMLTSISLVPSLYIHGIEAIEFRSLAYNPVYVGTSGYLVQNKQVRIDAGEAFATYRLSPNSVDLNTIGDYEFLAAKAAVRSVVEDGEIKEGQAPVKFNGIKNYDPAQGLLTVNLKKTTNEDFGNRGHELDAKKQWLVALKVNRKDMPEKGQTAAEIYSENSILCETDFTPQIADLKKQEKQWAKPCAWENGVIATNDYLDSNDPLKVTAYGYHFLDSVSVYESFVDENQLVYANLQYDQAHDISKWVTGCVSRVYGGDNKNVPTAWNGGTSWTTWKDEWTARKTSTHEHMSKEELKAYGIEFRYHIAGYANDDYTAGNKAACKAPYTKDVDHSTNQQEFARIDPVTGILIAKTPEDNIQNRAVLGKEPIIRIDLVNVNNGDIIDQRYLKVKWSEVEKPVEPVTIKIENDADILNCDSMYGEITWREFIDAVYAQIGEKGLSQKQFEEIYPVSKVVVTGLRWTYQNGVNTPAGNATYPAKIGTVADDGLPNVFSTTNVQGDALVATWSLRPEDVKRVYFDAVSNTKTFTAHILFKSVNAAYPDVEFDWSMIIKLPDLPELNGYYDNYWLSEAMHETHDVLPVQYNTELNPTGDARMTYDLSYLNFLTPVAGRDYSLTTRGEDKKYCIYDYALMSPFSFELQGNTPKFIVKGLDGYVSVNGKVLTNSKGEKFARDCYSYDLQFREVQDGLLQAGNSQNFAPWYSTAAATTGDGQCVTGHEPDVNELLCSQVPNTIEGPTSKDIEFNGGYDLVNTSMSNALAAEMYWVNVASADGSADQKALLHKPAKEYTAWATPRTKAYEYRNARLFLDHFNEANYALINALTDADLTTHDKMVEPVRPELKNSKLVKMMVWASLNQWNFVPVKPYTLRIIAPLRINSKLDGHFEDGHADGTRINWRNAFTMTDFRGYVVANTEKLSSDAIAALKAKGYTQAKQWSIPQNLYQYYEVSEPEWDYAGIRYTYKNENGTIKIDNTLSYAQSMTAERLDRITNGEVNLSIYADADDLVFKNNGGTNIEDVVYAYIPCSVTYGFGKVSGYAKVAIYPGSK